MCVTLGSLSAFAPFLGSLAGPVEALKIRGGNILKSQNLGGQYIVIGCIFSIREVNLGKKIANFSKNWGGNRPPAP